MPDALLSPSAAAYCLLGLACAVAFIFALRWLDNASQDKLARDLLDDIYPDPDKGERQ